MPDASLAEKLSGGYRLHSDPCSYVLNMHELRLAIANNRREIQALRKRHDAVMVLPQVTGADGECNLSHCRRYSATSAQ